MPRLRLTGPNGEVKTIRVSEVPDDAQMQEIVRKVFGDTQVQQPVDTQSQSISEPTGSIKNNLLSPTRLAISGLQQNLRSGSPDATAQERELDISEEGIRPGFREGVARGLSGAKGEIGAILELGATFGKNPIQTSKKIINSAKNIKKEDVIGFAGDLVSDFGKTFGFDINRPGVGLDKFDIDTAIDRWTNQPVGAIGDALIFSAAAKAATSAGKAGNKIAMHNALKRSGSEIEEMAEALVDAKNKAISRGANIATSTPGETVALSADVIKKIPLKNLNSPDFPKITSVQLSDHIFDIGKREGARMNKALDKVSKEPINTGAMGSSIKKQLVDEGFADNFKDAVDVAVEGSKGAASDVNIITPLNKSKLNQFMDIIDSGKPMNVKDLKNILDVVDDSINWITTRSSDNGLRIMRKSIRNELGRISPEYDKIASRISRRLNEIGYAENKIKRASREGLLRNYKENLGLEISKSEQKTKAFREAMEIVGDESAAAATGRFDLIHGWRAWNDLYETNQRVIRFTGDTKGRLIDRALTGARQRSRKLSPGLDFGSQSRRAVKKAGSAAKAVTKAARTVGRTGPVGVTLTEGLVEDN